MGKKHETVGSDILALYRSLQLPELVLGATTAASIQAVVATEWYPIEMLLEPLEALSRASGDSAVRKVGRKLFQLSHAPRLRGTSMTARELFAGFDNMYRAANRGENIGGWRVLRFDRTSADLETSTPHHCALEEGILDEALRAIGVPARIEQTACVRKNAPACIFNVVPRNGDAGWSDD
jgi:hypothetical protein